MPTASPLPDSAGDTAVDDTAAGRRFNPWHLLLLVPLLMLVVPWFNRDTPRLAGLPFFYWFQFAFVLVGVACVGIVVAMTRKRTAPRGRHTAGGDA